MSWLLLLLLMLITSCKIEPLTITKFQLCEFFDNQGVCKKEISNPQEYSILIPKDFKLETWDNLGNYLYFQKKITPGFLIQFNRSPSHKERKKILETYKAYYRFAELRGELAGFEFGETWIGSFDYLGSMIKDLQRIQKQEKSYPFLTNLFPTSLKFLYESEYFSGEAEFNINLTISREP